MNPNSQPHILQSFEQALTDIRSNVLMMAGLTTRGLGHAEKGLFARDTNLCGVAIADDEEIDSLEIQIDQHGVDALMKFQPVATDMRQIIASMKMGSNIERVGDQVVSIARRARKLNQHPPLEELALLKPMFQHASEMFSDSVKHYADHDQESARLMKDRDRKLDEMNRNLTDIYAECMAKDLENLRGYLNLIFISRVLERIGDHATNICEEVVFVCSAEDIRHTQGKAKD